MQLHPGELFVAQKPTLITTILGSCVSISLYCRKLKIGAMCHGLMPSSPKKEKTIEDSFRFVDSCVSYMTDFITTQHNLSYTALEAKLFGGANMHVIEDGIGSITTVGAQNIETARSSLSERGIPIVAEKTGGLCGCKLFFYTHTGEILLKRINRQNK